MSPSDQEPGPAPGIIRSRIPARRAGGTTRTVGELSRLQEVGGEPTFQEERSGGIRRKHGTEKGIYSLRG